MALFSLICHYRDSSNDIEEILRTYFENMYKRLDEDVCTTIDRARKNLLEASELKVDMKWTNICKRIYDKLSYGNHNVATALLVYKDISSLDSQNCGLLDQMIAKIDNQNKLDEKQDESSHKYTHSVLTSNMQRRSGLCSLQM